MRRYLFIAMTLCVSASLLFAGGGNESTENEPSEPVLLKYDTWYPPQNIMDELMAIFEADNPDVKVETVVTTPQDRLQRFPVQLASGEVMDVMGVLSGRSQLEPLVTYLAPLEPLFEKYVGPNWETNFDRAIIAFSRGLSDQMYLMQIGSLGSDVVYYNADMFDEMNLAAPETFDELADVVAVIKDQRPDLLPISYRGALPFLNWFALMTFWAQHEDLSSPLLAGTMKYNDPRVVEAATWWVSLYDGDRILSRDTLDIDNARSGELFYQEQAAMWVTGSWNAGLLSSQWRETNNTQFAVGAFVPSIVEGETPTMMTTPDLGLAIHARTEHPAEAMELLKFMTMGPGMERVAAQFIVFPAYLDYRVDTTAITGVGLEGYERIRTAMANPRNPRRDFDAISTEFGRVLSALVLDGADESAVATALDDFQANVEAGRF